MPLLTVDVGRQLLEDGVLAGAEGVTVSPIVIQYLVVGGSASRDSPTV